MCLSPCLVWKTEARGTLPRGFKCSLSLLSLHKGIFQLTQWTGKQVAGLLTSTCGFSPV